MSESDRKSSPPPSLWDLTVIVAIPVIGILLTGGGMLAANVTPVMAVVYAMTVTLTGACIGGLTLAVIWRYMPDFLPQAILAAMGMRMMITLIGIVVFVLILPNIGVRFVIYTIGFYFVGLVCETVIAVKKLVTPGPR